MKLDQQKIKQILVKGSYVNAEDMAKAEESANKQKIDLIDYLYKEQHINKDMLGQAIAEYYKIPYFDLNSYPPSEDNVRKIPEGTARRFHIAIAKEEKGKVYISTDEPDKKGLMERLEKMFEGFQIVLNYSLTEDIESTFAYYRKPLDTRCERIIKNQVNAVSEVVSEIIKEAISFNASDIHFEPLSKEFLIRFRIDGVLHEAARIDVKYYGNVLNRIKVQADLRIDEHQTAQDGAIRYADKNVAADIRVSIAPTINGEKAVLRILSKHVKTFNMADLGLSPEDEKVVLEASERPFGMMLVTGPTGSGKTTTLYALLKLLDQPEVNITTIEDPVEYRIETINQIQVNEAKNITFAKGLRSIVRQDPDIILVGEIRDKDTAEIAINAALTGHLLLSTFHANNAAAAVPRLLDMGVEPFLMSSTLEMVIAQRLVRKLCDSCRYSISVLKEEVSDFPEHIVRDLMAVKNIYKGKGCPACNNTGYKGRVGIFEVIDATPEIKEAIMKSPSSSYIWEVARKQGSKSLFEDGIRKVKAGITSLEELKRVASPEEY